MVPFLYFVFFLSGVAGLVYESVWSRYLGLFVGHGAYAQVIVLVVFLGGLAVGSLLAGHFSERVRAPLLWYAGVELAVGVLGFAFHDVSVFVTGLARASVFPALAGTPALLVAVKWGLASALILPPAVLLGTTFPFMSAGILRMRPARPGHTLSLLYFVNSLGGALGALLAGFVLLAWVGLPGTVLAAGTLNMVAALGAWLAWRTNREALPGPPEPYTPAAEDRLAVVADADGRDLWHLLLAVSFGTALASFIYEIAWIRMLSLVLGAATHSFELMLSAFILGLATGSLFIRKRADGVRPLGTLALIQWCMGGAALLTLPVYMASFQGTASLLGALDATEGGYALFNLGRYGLALAVMLPSTFCAGMTLPLITRTLLVGPRGERAIGWVYGVNTLGSIVGVALASLVLLPLVGLKALLVLGALVDMLLGVALVSVSDRRRGTGWARTGAAVVATVAMTMSVVLLTRLDQAVLASGVYRTGAVTRSGEITWWKDGRTASVSVTDGGWYRSLSTNGKVDASLTTRWIDGAEDGQLAPFQLDEPTQTLLALTSLAHAPGARRAAVVGQGSGMTSHMLLGSPVLEEVVTVEIEPAMIEGSRFFLPANSRVFEDPRARFVIDDAKSWFAANADTFDIILSEPSNPWVSGVASLFTAEFYQQVTGQLSSDGVFGQWLQLYEIDDRLILVVLAALHRSFSDYRIFLSHRHDLLIVATNAPGGLREPDWSIFGLTDVAAELEDVRAFTPAYLERTRFLNRQALAPLLDRWRGVNSDYFPILDLGAEKTRFLDQGAFGFLGAAAPGFEPSDVHLPPLEAEDPGGAVPILDLPVFEATEIAAELRRRRDGDAVAEPSSGSLDARPPRSASIRDELESALHDEDLLAASLERDRAPASWSGWWELAQRVAARRHGGTRGWVDRDFYERLLAFVRRQDGPAGLAEAALFHRHLDARAWPELAELVRESGAELDPWIPADLHRDAGVTALLQVGDVVAARALYQRRAHAVQRAAGDLRSRLLEAYLLAAEEAADRSGGG